MLWINSSGGVCSITTPVFLHSRAVCDEYSVLFCAFNTVASYVRACVCVCVYFCCRHFYKSYLFDYFCRQITIWFKLYFSISVDLRLSLYLPTYLWLRSRRKKARFLKHPCGSRVYESIYVLLLSTHGFDYYLSWSCILFEGRKHWGFYYVHGKHLRLSPVRWRGISPPLTDTQKLEYNTFWKAY